MIPMNKLVARLAFVISILVLTVLSCKDTTDLTPNTTTQTSEYAVPAPPSVPIGKNIDIVSVMASKGGKLGNIASYMTDLDIAEATGKPRNEIVFNDASKKGSDPQHTSGFYKWEDFDVRGAGIFVQVFKNPFPDDIPDYISRFVEQKRTSGEKDYEGVATLFQKLDWGDAGCYDPESAKYFWSLGNEVAFQIAFNTSYSHEEQLKIATTLAERLTRNFAKI